MQSLTNVVDKSVFRDCGARVDDEELVVDPAGGPAVAKVLQVDLGFVQRTDLGFGGAPLIHELAEQIAEKIIEIFYLLIQSRSKNNSKIRTIVS